MNIRMVDLKGQYEKIKQEINSEIQKVIDDTAFINGPKVKEFANHLSEYLGGTHIVPCANGTDALQIALMALDLQPGDEVIVPVHTYVATAEVIALLKLTPVFVDVDPDYFTIDISQIKNKITHKTKAIVPVHMYGQCADMEPLMQLAHEHHLYVVEDTAQAIGAKYTFSDGKEFFAGTIGNIGTTSFFPSKNLGAFGDGGALFVQDKELAEKCRMIANHGQSIKYHHDIIGCNSRLDTLQAAILDVKLKYLDDYSSARKKAAKYYNKQLKGITGIKTPSLLSKSTHVYHQYTIVLDESIDRNHLKEYLKEKGIPTMVYYPVPLHQQKAYRGNNRNVNFPVTEKLSETVLSLPIHTEITTNEQDFIVSSIKDFFKK
ncbi:MAG TPA: DegT/DnrJ/EryC1/StrS family aminotransferase [Bacteroidales bacterium]|nr:DegT/DnrJ/EryC1/StrS family aminotransferase [Bacteroidales bacterium]